MKFVDITMENIILATEIEMKFWPDSCAYNSYYRAYKKGKPYWLVFDNDKLVGITGIYDFPELGEPETAWLGWFGVLDKYRGYGYGKKILLETIKRAKDMGYKKLRLYSSKREDLCPNAVPFYTKISSLFNGFVEDYTIEQLEMQRIVVSFSLDGKPISKWNNRSLYLDDDKRDEEEGYKNYLIYKKSKERITL